jgi:hypothetical protein
VRPSRRRAACLPFPRAAGHISWSAPHRGSLSRHRPSDDARCATQDPPHAVPPRRRSPVRLATDRVQRARLARTRRRRGSDESQQDVGAAGASDPLSVLVPRARSRTDHTGHAARSTARCGRCILPVSPAAADAGPVDRGCAGQPARSRGWIQRRTRHRRGGQSSEGRGVHRAANVGRRGLAVHADRGLGTEHRVPSRHPRRRTASGPRSPSRRR